MENLFKKPYEISLWEDVLSFVYEDGTIGEEVIENEHGAVTAQFFKERKICVIGSDSMDTPIRAFNSKLVSNTNGSSTLTFSLFYKYYDMETGQLLDNPFIKLMVNERKIKLRRGELGASDCKWYDFVIKNIQKNSENKTINYTAKDLFINELSKSGFDIELDAKLENNQGTIWKLGETVLEGSDWQIDDSVEKTVFKQTIKEPLYKITLAKDIEAINMENEEETIFIAAKDGKVKEIYGFYTPINEESPYFQFVYVEDGKYEVDENYVITNSPNYYIDGVTYKDGIPSFAENQVLAVSDEYRGARLVRKELTDYDSIIDKYVNVYEDENEQKIYGYVEDVYISPTTVSNYVTNPTDYETLAGWQAVRTDEDTITPASLELITDPDIFKNPYAKTYIPYIKFVTVNENQKLLNTGISDFRSQINGFVKDKEYIFRYKEKGNEILKAKVCSYEISNGVYKIKDTYLSFDSEEPSSNEYTQTIKASCAKSLSYSEMAATKLGLFIYSSSQAEILLKDAQFFAYETDDNGAMCVPGATPASVVKEKYYYYNPEQDPPYKNLEEVVFIYEGDIPSNNYTPRYNGEGGYEKVRSITATESNRFNLIQDLCEIFECWPKFRIEHNEATGEILLGKDKKWYDKEDKEIACPSEEKYRQQKFVTFHEYIGKDNDVGFRYGINLKSISRTIESDSIVSKMVVKNNSNEHATDGFCSIARAKENPSGENFIFDFSYYINQKLLKFSEINNDLYMDTSGYLGYYKKLKNLNKTREQLILKQSKLLIDESKLEANHQTYSTSVHQAEEQKLAKLVELDKLIGWNPEERGGYRAYDALASVEGALATLTNDEKEKWLEDWKLNPDVRALFASIVRLAQTIETSKTLSINTSKALVENKNEQQTIKKTLDEQKAEKLKLELQFYKKYSRFIQEGSWIEENYVDDNLYYLDAESTLHTSSQPRVTYNINVLELSRIPGYENYIFNLGDKTYIEDTEFFGWELKEGVQTPRKETIIVNEITIALDSPEQNQIKVQNYKTQFEDLFQRITATTQAVEYSTGEYNKAASIVETDGTISINTLQNSMANNALVISNARDQSVVWDETGITTSSLSSPNEVVRIVSGGIFLSTDGGINWHTGISGHGINANYITTGQLDTSLVRIMAGAFPSFRWDSVGLSAYEFELTEDGKSGKNFNFSKFVRFDQYGLYGINGYSNFNPLTKDENGNSGEDKIWKYADFALTWKGFSLKNDNGSVRITSTDDIQVLSGEQERIKIGRLGDSIYGIRISDANGAVMETDNEGELWLKNKLNVETTLPNKTVGIGNLGNKDDTHGNQVINATDAFIVYEDGHIKAESGSFKGHIEAESGSFKGKIEATSGSIGGLTIEQWEEKGYELQITSNMGISVKEGQKIVLTAQLYHGTEKITNVSYKWYKANTNDLLSSEQNYTTTINFDENGFIQYECRAELKEDENG